VTPGERGERIAKLEAILARVRARSQEGHAMVRRGAGGVSAHTNGVEEEQEPERIEIDLSGMVLPHAAPPVPPPVPPRPFPPRPVAPPFSPRPDFAPVIAPLAPPMGVLPAPAPPPAPVPPPPLALEPSFPAAMAPPAREAVVDLSRPKTRPDQLIDRGSPREIELDPAVAPASEAPTTVESAPPPDMADMTDVDDLLAAGHGGPDVHASADRAREHEEEEPAPSSSRRPVGPEPAEKLAQMAFGDESSPALHTPPPESGRLPAATPDLDFDADVTGVRDARKAPPHDVTLELVPEVTEARIEARASVADVLGDAQRFAPATFGDLLDASLSL
jgi:hypothetical protein